jgi:hypothetical protein
VKIAFYCYTKLIDGIRQWCCCCHDDDDEKPSII